MVTTLLRNPPSKRSITKQSLQTKQQTKQQTNFKTSKHHNHIQAIKTVSKQPINYKSNT